MLFVILPYAEILAVDVNLEDSPEISENGSSRKENTSPRKENAQSHEENATPRPENASTRQENTGEHELVVLARHQKALERQRKVSSRIYTCIRAPPAHSSRNMSPASEDHEQTKTKLSRSGQMADRHTDKRTHTKTRINGHIYRYIKYASR